MITSCSRAILISINMIFFLMAIALIVLGFILRFGEQYFQDIFADAIDDFKESVKDVFLATDLDTSFIDMNELFNAAAIAAIILGFVFLAFCFFGLFGACCKSKCMLILYVVILCVLALTQLALIILVAATPDTMKNPLKNSLEDTLDKFSGLNGTDAKTLTWNVVMIQFDCCGVSNWEDFKDHPTWWGVTMFKTPLACCHNLPTSRSEADACAGTPTTAVTSLTNTDYDRGCLDVVWSWLFNHPVTTAAAVGSLCFEVMMIIFGVLLIYYLDEDKVSPSNDNDYGRDRNGNRRFRR